MSTGSAAWLAQHRQVDLNEEERRFRDQFVTEYLLDYSPVEACIRLGFAREFATDYSAQYMGCAYVQAEIKRREVQDNVADASSDDGIRKRIKAGLFREAHNQFAKPSSRIAALKALADIYGMNAPIKQEITATVESNVKFYLPSNGRDVPAVPQQPQEMRTVEEAVEVPPLMASVVLPVRQDSAE